MEFYVLLLFVITAFLFVNMLGAVILMQLDDHLDFINAFYLMMTTSSTVGYASAGPISNSSKVFMSFWQFIPIGLFFFGISQIQIQTTN